MVTGQAIAKIKYATSRLASAHVVHQLSLMSALELEHTSHTATPSP